MRTSFEGIVLLHVKARLPGAVHASARRGLSASQFQDFARRLLWPVPVCRAPLTWFWNCGDPAGSSD